MSFGILVLSLDCLNQDGKDKNKIETCKVENEGEEYCVFKQLGYNLNSTERGCVDQDDIKLKHFYNITDTGCIECRNLRDKGQANYCMDLLNKKNNLEHDEMVCFCKKDQCNYSFSEIIYTNKNQVTLVNY